MTSDIVTEVDELNPGISPPAAATAAAPVVVVVVVVVGVS